MREESADIGSSIGYWQSGQLGRIILDTSPELTRAGAARTGGRPGVQSRGESEVNGPIIRS